MKQHLPKIIVIGILAIVGITTWRLYSVEEVEAWYGYVEGEYVLIGLPVGGVLETLDVTRGDMVEGDKTLFALEAVEEKAGVEEARASLDQAIANRDNLLKGLRDSEIDAILAQKEQALAELDLARLTLKRQTFLFEEGHISNQAVDEAEASYKRAQGRADELEAQLVTARLPARADEILKANAAVESARAVVEKAEFRFSKRFGIAPKKALVFDTFYRLGEYVPASKGVVSLLPEDNVKVRFFIPERDLATTAVGQQVTILCDACGDGIAAKISYIAPEAEFTPPVIYSEEARQKLSYMIEAYPLDPRGFPLKPGQPVEVQK